VTDLTVLGSVARGAAGAVSVFGLLFARDGPATWARDFGVMLYLEDLPDPAVEPVTV